MIQNRTWTEFKKQLYTNLEAISKDAKQVNRIFEQLNKRNMTIKEFAQKSGVHQSDIEKLEYERPNEELLNKISWILNYSSKENTYEN